MPSSRSPRRAVAGVLLAICSVAAGCVAPTTPTIPPASVVPPSITATASPSGGPTPVPGGTPIGAAWELVHTPRRAAVADIARGPDGWVAGGWAKCREKGCGRFVAATWFSSDGITWTGGPIALGRHSGISTVATDGDRWFAVGYGSEGRGEAFRQEALIWRSPNGRDWTQVGSMPLDPPEKGLGAIGELAAGPGGLVLTYFDPVDPEPVAAYWSENGETWQPIDNAVFRLPPDQLLAFFDAAMVVDGRFVMASVCGDCGTVWSSRNGRDWRLERTLNQTARGLAIGSDGRRVVVAVSVGDCASECAVEIWRSDDGRTGWERTPQVLPVGEPRLTYAAESFILTGTIEDRDDPDEGAHVFTSPDGLTWTEFVETDFDVTECYFEALEGGDDRAVLLGTNDCEGIWVSLAP